VKVKPFKSEFNELILDDMRENNIRCWIAGGVLRDYLSDREMVTDCDMFFPNEEEYMKCRNFLIDNGGEIIWESDNGVKINYKGSTYDLVKFFAKDPEETIEKFDFTLSQFAIDGDNLYYGDTSFEDLKDNKLVLKYITNPFSTLKRALSHYGKGFYMDGDEMEKLYKDVFIMSDYNLEAVSPYQAQMNKIKMKNATGIYKGDVGRTMAIWAYVGVFAGTLALYKYLDLFDKDKKKLLIGYGIVFAGLAAGSAIGSYRVSQK
tara:strand:+ start:2109 stop:2894 length:786 start_codon:yes stop_codon:yes gene_type:complete